MDYLQWNDAIASHFFSSEKDGSRVFLYVTTELIQELGTGVPDPMQDFIEASLTGPPWVKASSGFCQKALQAYKDWRNRVLDYPPYITSLALFVLAAGHEGDFAAHAYYPRLWKLLGENKSGAPPSFREMYVLWSDLEEWSQFDMGGSKGVFYAYLPGSWIHVGLPTAQTLLTEQEVSYFPIIFANANLDPTIEISDNELFMLMVDHGMNCFRPVTLNFLRNPGSVPAELRSLLGEVLQDHLHSWSGEVVLEGKERAQHKCLASLILCCRAIDKVAGQFKMELRCKTTHQLPEHGLTIIARELEEEFEIKPSLLQWSSPLVDKLGKNLNPVQIDWTKNFLMSDKSEKFEFRFRGKKLRIFISAFNYGFQGYVEVDRLAKHDSEFYLFVHDSIQEKIVEWASNGGCKKITPLNFNQGLPGDWGVYRVDTVISDVTIKKDFPSLAIPISTRVQFQNGIRVSKGNTFFEFAKPDIIVDSCEKITEVICDGKTLSHKGDGFYELPDGVESGKRCVIDVRSGGQSIAQKSFALESRFTLVSSLEAVNISRFGIAMQSNLDPEITISGAFVSGVDVSDFVFTVLPELSEMKYRRAVMLGSGPGQIAVWPISGELRWQPVWLIIIKGRRDIKALFCGESYESSLPLTKINVKNVKDVKQWKEFLWHKRKRINEPGNKIERNLWKQYLEVAKNV